MQENEQPFEAWTGYYKIEYLDEEPKVTEKELFDTVFAKLEKIQKQAILEKIKRAEAQLISLGEELDIFLAKK
ncbi:hypothetical protein C5N99_01340 [Treponema medium]|uniref:Uncharacterized protein n=2 Tax=Treponema medium TaxID=58231 RepID=A0AA87TH33_TREMD|nr:hypothetical protein [Treponema medium]EPF29559.1 hypothetical protein HMPREF9195_00260 [Treponema medium ATCC 700293]QSH91288.1 hypothetical protein C5N99_01340 [Treponema medium]QSH96420.1 hypothetical protein DWB79_01305 [Treponema medium]